jgi:hypothetical protein
MSSDLLEADAEVIVCMLEDYPPRRSSVLRTGLKSYGEHMVF